MFRSEDMSLHQVVFAKESMWETMNFLSYSNKVMFIDHSKYAHKGTVQNSLSEYACKMVNRCDDLMSSVDQLKESCQRFNFELTDFDHQPNHYYRKIDKYCSINNIEGHEFFTQMEKHTSQKFNSFNKHQHHYFQLIEQRLLVYQKIQAVNHVAELVPFDFTDFTRNGYEGEKKFCFLFGILQTKQLEQVRKIVFRTSRLNVIMRQVSLPPIKDSLLEYYCDTYHKHNDQTLLFIIYPQTDQNILDEKIRAILQLNEFIFLDIPRNQDKTV